MTTAKMYKFADLASDVQTRVLAQDWEGFCQDCETWSEALSEWLKEEGIEVGAECILWELDNPNHSDYVTWEASLYGEALVRFMQGLDGDWSELLPLINDEMFGLTFQGYNSWASVRYRVEVDNVPPKLRPLARQFERRCSGLYRDIAVELLKKLKANIKELWDENEKATREDETAHYLADGTFIPLTERVS